MECRRHSASAAVPAMFVPVVAAKTAAKPMEYIIVAPLVTDAIRTMHTIAFRLATPHATREVAMQYVAKHNHNVAVTIAVRLDNNAATVNAKNRANKSTLISTFSFVFHSHFSSISNTRWSSK